MAQNMEADSIWTKAMEADSISIKAMAATKVMVTDPTHIRVFKNFASK